MTFGMLAVAFVVLVVGACVRTEECTGKELCGADPGTNWRRDGSPETLGACSSEPSRSGCCTDKLLVHGAARLNGSTQIIQSEHSAFVELSRHGSEDLEERLEIGLQLKRLGEFFSSAPATIPDAIVTENELCRNHSRVFLEELRRMKLWALQMFDSSAKPPSGILRGNVNQFGDFDECLNVESNVEGGGYGLEDSRILGKYCLANLQVEVPGSNVVGELNEVSDLLHSHYLMRSKLEDPGHRLPRFSAVNWAFCIPASCSSADLEVTLRDSLKEYNNTSGFRFDVMVDQNMCYVKEEQKVEMSRATLLTMYFFGTVLLLALASTIRDYLVNNENEESDKTNAFTAFSLRRNVKTLLDTSTSKDDITCLHGIRALNAIALIICHKAMALYFNPYTNRTGMAEVSSGYWTSILRTAILFTESFIMLSGLLTAYNFTKELDRKSTINVPKKVLSRFIRLTPNLLAVILFSTYLVNFLGSGPQWNLVVKHYSDICQENMWKNLFYIHNYFGFENMCLTHTHQLGMDMQLFIASPLFVYALWRWPKIGFAVAATASLLSTILRYVVTYNKDLSVVVYYGVKVSQLFNTANFSYILPTHRATTYLFGIVLGYLLRRMPKDLAFTKPQLILGYTLAVGSGLAAIFGPCHMGVQGYKYDASEAALYSALSPMAWCAMLCFGIVVCHTGHGGYLNLVLTWKGFIVFTRVAYAVYLTQFPIFFFNVGTTRSPKHFSTLPALINAWELGAISVTSILLTLLFDLPFQEVKKALLDRESSANPSSVTVNSSPKKDISVPALRPQRKARPETDLLSSGVDADEDLLHEEMVQDTASL